MILCTTETVPGKRIVEVYGLVRGTTIRARHVGRDIQSFMRNLTGGELVEYTKMMAEAREEAIGRLLHEARLLNANAVIGLRFQTSMIVTGAAEMLCYGTAVRIEDEPSS